MEKAAFTSFLTPSALTKAPDLHNTCTPWEKVLPHPTPLQETCNGW